MTETTCYYCRKNKSSAAHAAKKTIYNKLDSNYGIGLTGIKKTTRYYEKEFSISRCASCHYEHHRDRKKNLIVMLVTAIVTGVITWFPARRVYICIIAGIVCGIVAMALYIEFVYRKRIKALGILDEGEVKDYEPIKILLENGWQEMKP